jgi:hypothetical protein
VVIGDFKHEHNHDTATQRWASCAPTEYAATCRHTHTPLACDLN